MEADREKSDAEGSASHHDVRLDMDDHTAWIAGRAVALTRSEYRILEALLAEPGRIFSRAELQERIDPGAVIVSRTIDVHIAALRRKLRATELIETARGQGYRWRSA